jgi:hypothetical protein
MYEIPQGVRRLADVRGVLNCAPESFTDPAVACAPGAVRLRSQCPDLGQGPDVGSGLFGQAASLACGTASADRADGHRSGRAAGAGGAPAVEIGVGHCSAGWAEVDADPGGMGAAGRPESVGRSTQCVIPLGTAELPAGTEHQRTSNFLPWQDTYAELLFLDTPWPAVDRRTLWNVIEQYAGRTRRCGSGARVPAQTGLLSGQEAPAT